MCDLVGLYMLNVLTNEFGKERVGLYRDDGLVLIKGKSGRIADKARKKIAHIIRTVQLENHRPSKPPICQLSRRHIQTYRGTLPTI